MHLSRHPRPLHRSQYIYHRQNSQLCVVPTAKVLDGCFLEEAEPELGRRRSVQALGAQVGGFKSAAWHFALGFRQGLVDSDGDASSIPSKEFEADVILVCGLDRLNGALSYKTQLKSCQERLLALVVYVRC